MSGILRIPFITESDSGDYQCVADNGVYPSVISNFTITIHGRNWCMQHVCVCMFYCVFSFSVILTAFLKSISLKSCITLGT